MEPLGLRPLRPDDPVGGNGYGCQDTAELGMKFIARWAGLGAKMPWKLVSTEESGPGKGTD
jgi:hypothetical protein